MRHLLALTLVALAAWATARQPEPAKDGRPRGTIAFSSLAPRGWNLYVADVKTGQARRLTAHPALDYNASFDPTGQHLAFVSERDGNMELYRVGSDGSGLKRLTRDFALDDHPAWSPDGKRLAFVSTRQAHPKPGRAWNAVYVMDADGNNVRRVSPKGTSDYSPAWSPKGDLLVCVSGSGKPGGTDLYVMRPDGSGRRLVIRDGGWPTFSADGEGLFFHRKRDDRWGIWRVRLDGTGLERVTPEDVEASTPRAGADGKSLVVAVKRGERRQIELLDLATKRLTAVTKGSAEHWNPSLSPDGWHVVYHKAEPGHVAPNVELWGAPPGTELRLLRLGGAFPAFSPDYKRVALTGGNFARIDVMDMTGSNRKTIFEGKSRTVFSLSWAHSGGRIAFSHGTAFQGPEGEVNIETIAPDGSGHRKLTTDSGNNGFPSYAPDGKRLVFRSGRDGSKNLYVVDADGKNVRRLTEGKWTDTMADWSPTGEWIAFASDRGGNFEVWLIKPDGTGLKKLIGGGGRHNHPHFSPDGQWVVFTSQRAGLSAEEISLPRQPQAYGDLFLIRLDGTGLTRLTHNGFEEGTPAWAPVLDLRLSGDGRKGPADEY
ncbi:MAG: DPP IV N-terminal domain-containing protein [Gemmataceae bacterium]|nr:DPP IV N-terminal domain-containing protein [Gemmataceae bacterium]